MNYRHTFHAGNFADLAKHLVLISLIVYSQRKEKPICIIDTHAGSGFYDFSSVMAQKNCEFKNGVLRLYAANHVAHAETQYLKNLMIQYNPSGSLRFYPGSPKIAAHLLRPRDQLILIEKHPKVFQELSQHMQGTPSVHLHQRDAYEALNAMVPPPSRRGLVLIDPPFEVSDEWSRIKQTVRMALKKWPNGIFLIWYPIKPGSVVMNWNSISQNIHTIQIQAVHCTGSRLSRCGLCVINPPFQWPRHVDQLIHAVQVI